MDDSNYMLLSLLSTFGKFGCIYQQAFNLSAIAVGYI